MAMPHNDGRKETIARAVIDLTGRLDETHPHRLAVVPAAGHTRPVVPRSSNSLSFAAF